MSLKLFLQSILLLLIIFIIAAFYYLFLYDKNTETLKSEQDINQNEINLDKEIANELVNIEYNSSDKNGNTFYINSRKAIINLDDKTGNKVSMEDVVAIINLKNKGIINISSKNANYNRMTHDTSFYNNVNIEYLGNLIVSQNLDVLFTEDRSNIYTNVIFNNNNLKLYTDIISVDMLTGDIKLEMKNNSDNVKLITNYEYVN